MYLRLYVQDAGYGDTDLMVYVPAEASLERCSERAERESVWRFELDDAPLFEAILRQVDRQLDRTPSYVHMKIGSRGADEGRRCPVRHACR